MEQLLQILVFKTNIKTTEHKDRITPLLDACPAISRWTVDCEDCDCVLRVEAEGISEEEIISLVQDSGFRCEALDD